MTVAGDGAFTPTSASTLKVSILLVGSMIRPSTNALNALLTFHGKLAASVVANGR